MAATAVLIPMEEYLRTSYKPDREWIEGEVRKRSMPDLIHALIQKFFLYYFELRRRELGVLCAAEVRVRVAPRRFRIPDVLLLPASAPFQRVPDSPPILCIEILSRTDSMGEMQEKIADYVAMGVGAIWLIDPRRRRLFMADADGTHPVELLEIPGTGVRLGGSEIFAELDELGTPS